jgi:hypothetical protein
LVCLTVGNSSVGTDAGPVQAERSVGLPAATTIPGPRSSSNRSRISFVASNPSFSYSPAPRAGVQIDRPQAPLLDPARIVSMICRATPRLRNSGSVYTFRITARSVHGSLGFAGHGPAAPRRRQRRGPRRPAPASGDRNHRQSPRQPRTCALHHAIQFLDRAFPHVAKHRPPVMKNDRRLARRCFSNRNQLMSFLF